MLKFSVLDGQPGGGVAVSSDPAPQNWWLASMALSGLSAASVKEWFRRLYDTLGMTGCSSHSGRRTFITQAARKVSDVGGSIRDVQQLAGHTSLAATQRYIKGSSDAKRRLVEIV
jgi:integrase/recombinase XerC